MLLEINKIVFVFLLLYNSTVSIPRGQQQHSFVPFMHFALQNNRNKSLSIPFQNCSSFLKHSIALRIYTEITKCKTSLSWIVNTLKTCRYSTDALELSILIPAKLKVKQLKTICKCLLSEHAVLFLIRGVSFDVHSPLHKNVFSLCKIPKYWTPLKNLGKLEQSSLVWRNISNYNNPFVSGTLVIGNRFSQKNWNVLRHVENKLFEVPGPLKVLPDKSLTAQGVLDLQQFFTSVVCQILGQTCEKTYVNKMKLVSPLRLLNNSQWSGSLGLLQASEVHIIVYQYPVHGYPWEVELSPALSFDRVRFAIRKQWDSKSYLKFVKPFTTYLWIAIISCVILLTNAMLALEMLQKKLYSLKNKELSSVYSIIFRFFAALLDQSQGICTRLRKLETYILVGLFWLVANNLGTHYKTKLVENLIRLYPLSVPTTYDELFHSEYKIGINSKSGVSDALSSVGEDLRLTRDKRVTSLSCMALTLVDTYACISLADSNKLDITKLKYLLGIREPIKNIWQFSHRFGMHTYTTWAFRRGFPFKEKINDILGRILQAGLQDKWYEGILKEMSRYRHKTKHISPTEIFANDKLKLEYYFKLTKYLENFNTEQSNSEVIKLKHLQPLFYLQIMMFLLASIMFAFEWTYYWVRRIRFSVVRTLNTITKSISSFWNTFKIKSITKTCGR